MARTYEQMYEAALSQRQKIIEEGRDPRNGVFDCSKEEYLTILDTSPFSRYELSAARHRLCGLLIVEDGHCPNCASYVVNGAPHAWGCGPL